MKQFIKSLLPKPVLKSLRPIYHGLVAIKSSINYGIPSDKMVVIGVTGTAGKSSTVNLLAHILNNSGKKCGFITTTNYSYGDEPQLNKHGLSMPSGGIIQKQLDTMVKNGCQYAVIECTSEGLEQNRHWGINFDMALFTNLSPAHIEAHGGFDAYKSAKGKLFVALEKSRHKKHKIIGVNLDDKYADYFLNFNADKKFGVTLSSLPLKEKISEGVTVYTVDESDLALPTKFKVENTDFTLHIPGEFSVYNAMLGIAAANMLGVSLDDSSKAVSTYKGTPGRLENIPNKKGFEIIVDFACEPVHFEKLLPIARSLTKGKLIHVFGSTGGARDVSKRFDFGRISAQYSDVIIITNDDVYDSDEKEIADNIEAGIKKQEVSGNVKATSVKQILDRREAIKYALSIAATGDLVLFTGKGSEQFLVLPGNQRIEWDEREFIKASLND